MLPRMLSSSLSRPSGRWFALRVGELLAKGLPVYSESNEQHQRISSRANTLPAYCIHHPRKEIISSPWKKGSVREFSTTREVAPASFSRNRNRNHHHHHQRKKKPNPNDDTNQEKKVRDATSRILELGQGAKSSATSGNIETPNLQRIVEERVFWTEADHALKWWTARATPESVTVSFQILDALADLSSIAQDPQSSSVILNTKTLNAVVQNWLKTWQRGDLDTTNIIGPDQLFQKLEQYRQDSQNTSWTRRKLKPNLDTYHILMEGSAIRNDRKPGFNESVLRHLMDQTHDQSIQPTLKTLAHIIHGLSSRGQVVSKEEFRKLLALMKELSPTKNETLNEEDLKPLDLFNTAIFALGDTRSDAKDVRSAEKMLLILNFMQTIAEEYPEMASDVHPDLDTYNVVLNGFSRAGKGAQAELVLQDMVRRYEEAQKMDSQEMGHSLAVKPVPKSFTIVITAYGNSEENRNAEKAEGVLRWQQHLNEERGPLQGSIPLDTITYNNVIRAWSWRRSDQAVERCDALRKEMFQRYNIVPNQQTYGQSLKCIALSNMKEKGRRAVQVWREMQFHKIEPDGYTRKYYEKCVAVRSKKWNNRRRRDPTESPTPLRAPRPFDY